MMNSRIFVRGALISALITLFTLLATIPAWAALSEPARIIEDTAGRILDELDSNREAYEENPDALEEIVSDELLPLLDQQYSARLILGRQGQGIPSDKLTEFAEALSGLLMNRYSSGLLRFEDRKQLEILPSHSSDSDRLTRVRTRIKLTNGGFAPVDYAFRRTDSGWKVFDVTIEGVSYVLTFRNQIAPLVAQEGIEKVTADLRAGRIEVSDY